MSYLYEQRKVTVDFLGLILCVCVYIHVCVYVRTCVGTCVDTD